MKPFLVAAALDAGALSRDADIGEPVGQQQRVEVPEVGIGVPAGADVEPFDDDGAIEVRRINWPEND